MRRSAAALAVATAALAILAGPAAASEFERYEVESVSAQLSSTLAGAHADFTTNFVLSAKEGEPFGLTRDVVVHLPPGMIGNPQGIPRCSALQLGNDVEESECPIDSQVGSTEITLGGGNAGTFTEPIYNMDPPGEEVVARLGFFAGPYPVTLNVTVDPVDYSLLARIEGAPAAASLVGASTTLWGVPAAAVHDPFRITPEEAVKGSGPPGGRKSGLPEAPFMTNPTSCGPQGQITVTATSYQLPGSPSTRSAPFPKISGCGALSFRPTFTLSASNPEAAAPTGVDADLKMAQDETPQGRATSTLRSAVVALPPGFTINPAAGDGLAACSAAQVGFERDEPAHCPEAAKIGSAEIEVPALKHVLSGAVYQRTPEPGHLFRFWLVSDELGVHLKLPAEIEADHTTGQLTTRFEGIPSLGGNPQVPVSELALHIFGGPRAPLATPDRCGTYQSRYEFAPWSGNPAAVGEAATQITSGCGKGGFAPGLLAGMLTPSAGRYSPFVFELTRKDGEANPSSLEVALPEGLLARLKGTALCPESAVGTATCPSSSQVGTVTAAAGVGGAPLWIPQPGKAPTAVYLAGPYKGAPYSLVVKVPAQAGPFDLGTVVTRAAIYIDPETARVRIASDPLPQILEGVPVSYRTIRVETNRPEFTLNPTSCAPKSIGVTVTASNGASASPSAGFQATNCAKLRFKPSLKLSLKGATKRIGHPGLRAVLTYPKGGGYANVARAQVNLPHAEFLDQGNLNKTCTKPVLLAGNCPKSSVYGKAKAWTPLLEKPLEGNVFLVGGYGYKLPALVAELNGQIKVLLVGKVDSGKNNGIRTTFEMVPDAPVEKFVLEMKGGKKYSLLENSENLCRKPQRAAVKFNAQSGKVDQHEIPIANGCKKGRGHQSGKKRGR
jgi:hypothetical protein